MLLVVFALSHRMIEFLSSNATVYCFTIDAIKGIEYELETWRDIRGCVRPGRSNLQSIAFEIGLERRWPIDLLFTWNDAMTKSFPLSRMSPLIQTLTVILLALPLALAVGATRFNWLISIPVAFVVVIYGWIWLRFRPTRFVVHSRTLEVIWPLKRREISREDISSVRQVDRQELTSEIGWGMRVGAGGLWGGFGWLWTTRRGIVQMYISRTDHFVWIERTGERPWLITPEQPEAFVRALSPQ